MHINKVANAFYEDAVPIDEISKHAKRVTNRYHVVSSDTAFAWLDQGWVDSVMPIIDLQWLRSKRDEIRQQWLEKLPLQRQ